MWLLKLWSLGFGRFGEGKCERGDAYGLCYVVDYDGAVRVSVVHWGEGLVAFLACCVPYFEFDGCGVVEGDGLGEEGGADGGFPVVIELILLRK